LNRVYWEVTRATKFNDNEVSRSTWADGNNW
jgi:hypothetical protein